MQEMWYITRISEKCLDMVNWANVFNLGVFFLIFILICTVIMVTIMFKLYKKV